MSQSLQYAKAFAVLLEDVQSAASETVLRSGLLRVRRFSRSQGLTVVKEGEGVRLDGTLIPRTPTTLLRLTTAMATHAVARLVIRPGAGARELLQTVLLMARSTRTNTAGATLFDELRELSLWDIKLYPVRSTTDHPESPTHAADVRLDTPGRINLRATDLVQQVHRAAAAKDLPGLVDGLMALQAIERDVEDRGLKALWTAAFDTAATEEAVRVLVAALPRDPDRQQTMFTILRRTGDRGANVIIDILLSAPALDTRRIYFDALVEIRRGVSRLLKLLDHEQWFVVRNAVCLLGEFDSRSSEPELAMKLSHPDARVRAAVVTALLRLNSPTALSTVRSAIRDESAEVRRRAVRGFVTPDGETSIVAAMLQALERETDLDVQTEFLHALGSMATPEAVQKLIRLCSGASSGSRHPDFRIAAAEALTTARTSAAIPFLRTMMKDPDVNARTAARHLIRAVS